MKLKNASLVASLLMCTWMASAQSTASFTTDQLKDKIKGGWAGQTIGVTFGGPYEFRFNGTFIGDYQRLTWYDGYLKKTMVDNPGLYDDLYMDLTFVDVIEKNGLDAPLDSFAHAFANAGYMLWHANQAARYNILNGVAANKSGYWMNNPHADCIDYQIESDFAGLMSPCMPNTASAISDKVGHIMNYGDGWYGGVFVGAMYSLAFVLADIKHIVTEALKCIPQKSDFFQCINDVIHWQEAYPGDWKRTWFEVQKKWTDEVGCPDGVFAPFNIDAKVNAAYVVIGLLYGNGDFTKTLEITTRCGQDADCNPSTAGGILGTFLGYDHIPPYWKQGLKEAEDIKFKYTTISLSDVYEMGYRQALQNIQKNGGSINGNKISVPVQKPVTVKLEKSFPDLYPKEKKMVSWSAATNEINFDYIGTGFVLKGEAAKWDDHSGFVIHAELYVDGKKTETFSLPASFTTRRHELCWKYDLPEGNHTISVKFLNASSDHPVTNTEAVIYSSKKNQ